MQVVPGPGPLVHAATGLGAARKLYQMGRGGPARVVGSSGVGDEKVAYLGVSAPGISKTMAAWLNRRYLNACSQRTLITPDWLCSFQVLMVRYSPIIDRKSMKEEDRDQ